MSKRYSIAGRTLATAATANHVAAQLWNPHASERVLVHEITWCQLVATVSNIAVMRTTARGATPTATVTPTIASDYARSLLPPSGAVLELATFGTQPTLEGVPLFRWNMAANIGTGFMYTFPEPVEVLPGSGLVVCMPPSLSVIIQPADVTFVLSE